MKRVELLSPAKNSVIGVTAINNGADAVYIGAPAFGARKAAANSVDEIRGLVEYAHRYNCRVFVTLNTILYDHELTEAERLIRQLYAVGVDALIVQDMGVLRMDLPPICLHASTQTHNYELERIKFLDKMGFQRIVLARELSLEQIRVIRQEVKAELEVFVHGALCVSLSGQCYLSHYMFGRSANRGECAQPCRMKWSVKDSQGKLLVDDRYILSLKDLNTSEYIKDLIDIGVESFKIEGRLKDENYVANITNYYSSVINRHPDVIRVGAGESKASFIADPERSFNRGHSPYFMMERRSELVNPDSPKSMGKKIGTALQVKGNRLRIEVLDTVNNGDGLCYFEQGELKGLKVNSVENDWLICNEPVSLKPQTVLFRNYDHRFVTQVEKTGSVRKVAIELKVSSCDGRLRIEATDEQGIVASILSEEVFEKANNPMQGERLKEQLMKCGDSIYYCRNINSEECDVLFVPTSVANQLRRNLLSELDRKREENRERLQPGQEDKTLLYPGGADWHLNIVNRNAAAFYRDHGVAETPTGFEVSPIRNADLMHTRYCILYELGRCRKHNQNADIVFPLTLFNDKHQFELQFDCQECCMKVKNC